MYIYNGDPKDFGEFMKKYLGDRQSLNIKGLLDELLADIRTGGTNESEKSEDAEGNSEKTCLCESDCAPEEAPSDILEHNGETYIKLNAAGFYRHNITIEVDGKTLVISGISEDEYSSDTKVVQEEIQKTFENQYTLTDAELNGSIEATLDNGILTVKITPKEPKRKLVEIN